MVLYFAARYGRREELVEYKTQLEVSGYYRINSRWLAGDHQIGLDGVPIGPKAEVLEASNHDLVEVREKFLNDDLEDCMNADAIVCFTEYPEAKAGRGGRHVEYGFILGWNAYARKSRKWNEKQIVIVGPRENLFHWYPEALQFPDWDSARNVLIGPPRPTIFSI